jgi:predicted helicase
MACGTGKTFTSLKIAESLAGAGKRVLFLVPSLPLLSQTLTEWTQESAILHGFAVCSDGDVGKKRKFKNVQNTVRDKACQMFAVRHLIWENFKMKNGCWMAIPAFFAISSGNSRNSGL